MKNYFNNWNMMRVIRLALGIFIIVQGVRDQQWILAIMGAAFSLMPILNIGCCSTAGCATRTPRSSKTIEDVSYEEIK